MAKISRLQKNAADIKSKMDAFQIGYDRYLDQFKDKWEDPITAMYRKIPVIGDIYGWLNQQSSSYTDLDLDMSPIQNVEEYKILQGADEDMIEGLYLAEEQMEDELNNAALTQAISLITNLVAPDVGEALKVGGKEGTLFRQLTNEDSTIPLVDKAKDVLGLGSGSEPILDANAVAQKNIDWPWQKMPDTINTALDLGNATDGERSLIDDLLTVVDTEKYDIVDLLKLIRQIQVRTSK